MTVPLGSRLEIAIESALVTRVAVCLESIDQPTTFLDEASSTAQQ